MHARSIQLDVHLNGTDNRQLCHLARAVLGSIGPHELPIRFVVTQSDGAHLHCETAVLRVDPDAAHPLSRDEIFRFVRRPYCDHTAFNVVHLVPTGIGADIGGHAGDAGPTARLLAQTCDTLITRTW